jgi:hypothetical protein
MTRYRLLSGSTAVLAACLISAPAALADDASLFGAYNARQGDFDAAGAAYVRAARRANRHHTRRNLRRVIAADKAMNRILTAIKSDLVAQSASSAHGRKARAAAFREVRWFRRANGFEIRGVRLNMRNRSAGSWLRRAERTVRRSYRQGRIAVRHFKAVGLKSPNGPISAN